MKGPLSLLIKKFLRIRLAPWRPLPRLCRQNFSDLLSRGSRLKTPGFSQTLNSNYHQPSTSPQRLLAAKLPVPIGVILRHLRQSSRPLSLCSVRSLRRLREEGLKSAKSFAMFRSMEHTDTLDEILTCRLD